MSHRPLNRKRARRMRKIIARRPLPRLFNLAEWLEDHGHAQSAGQANAILTEGRLRNDGGNILGREMVKLVEDDKDVVHYVPAPIVPVAVRDSGLRVVKSDA